MYDPYFTLGSAENFLTLFIILIKKWLTKKGEITHFPLIKNYVIMSFGLSETNIENIPSRQYSLLQSRRK
jgi:hypothetical protein